MTAAKGLSTADTPVAAAPLAALEERITAAIERERLVTAAMVVEEERKRLRAAACGASELDQLRKDVRDLVRTSLAALREELAREVVTERLAIVDRYRRTWIEARIGDDHAVVRVEHPDAALGLAAELGVHDETCGGESFVNVTAGGDLLGALSAHGDRREHRNDAGIAIGAELLLTEADGVATARADGRRFVHNVAETATTLTATGSTTRISPEPAEADR